MLRRTKYLAQMTGAAWLLIAVATPVQGAGFGIFEHGSKAMGMAGAFTAQADDGSTLFYNVGGLGFLEEKELYAGTTFIYAVESTLEGLDPFPGAAAGGEQETNLFFPSHLYYIRPIGDGLNFGFAFNSPFGLTTDWKDPFEWPGRFISVKAELHTFDLNPSLGWRVSDELSLGIGAVVRFSTVELDRHVPAVNPFTQAVIDAATVNLKSDFDEGFGWNVGILHRPWSRFSWGLSYRSQIEIDYGGDGEFTLVPTGNAALDAVIAGTIPIGEKLPVETAIEFPAMASLGMAFGLTEKMLVEVDVNWTGWGVFEELEILFVDHPELSSVILENYEDCFNYRIGLRVDVGSNQWRFGYVYDETPQPEGSMGPLLPDADRNGFTVGFGWRDRFDVALMYLLFDERTTTTSYDNFFGTYDTTAWLLGATLKF
ncbi:MAG: hypothetical protein GY856_52055 [bacterium]|nr:hypothetical protein [bacterium]